jgi:hypothetical protein
VFTAVQPDIAVSASHVWRASLTRSAGEPINVPRDRFDEVLQHTATINKRFGVNIVVPPPGKAIRYHAIPMVRTLVNKALTKVLGMAVEDGMPELDEDDNDNDGDGDGHDDDDDALGQPINVPPDRFDDVRAFIETIQGDYEVTIVVPPPGRAIR